MYTSMAAIWDNDLFGSDWFDKTWVSLSPQVNIRKTTKLQRWQRLYAGRLEDDNVKSSLPWVRPSPAVSCFLLLGLDSQPAMQKHNKHTLLWQSGTILCCVAIEHTAWNRHFFRCMPIFVRFEILKFLKLKAKTFLQRIRTLKNAHCLSCCHLQTHSTMIARERQKINWWCDQLGRTWSPLNRDLLHFSGQKRIRKRTNASRSRNTSETLASWEEMIEGRICWNKPLKP